MGKRQPKVLLWLLLTICYFLFLAVAIADFWSPIRYDLNFASTGLAAPLAGASYIAGLVIVTIHSLIGGTTVAKTLLMFFGVALVFGSTAWYLEAHLYIAAEEWGLGAFYLVAALCVAAVAGVLTLILRALSGRADE